MRLYEFNPSSTKPLLHLAHANGFLPQTYQESLKPLLNDYKIISFYPRSLWGDTDPKWLKHWSQMADDLIASLDGIKVKGIIGIGHSLGGVLTLYAAVKRPDLFSKVILIDPTMLPPKLLWQIRLMKLIGLDARSALIKGALRRKRNWDSAKAAYEYFRGRQLFKNWSDAVVKAYVESITEPALDGSIRLSYPPEWEARIYKTIPTDVWKSAKLIQQPTLVIRGETSNTFTEDSEKAFRKANPRVSFEVVLGAGHLVPQERPNEIGRFIRDFLQMVE